MIGAKLKERRTKLGLTLRQLASDAGLTASYISQVERDLIEPSIQSLRKMAGVLEVPIYYFLMEDEKSHILTRANERKILDDQASSMSLEFLSPMENDESFPTEMISMIFKIKPHASAAPEPLIHDGDEIIYVMSGEMRVILPNEEFVVGAGDSFYIKGNIFHEMINIGEAEVIGISTIRK